MHLEEIDMVGAEPAQRRVQGTQQMPTGAVAASAAARAQPRLGGDQQLVAGDERAQQRADHRLGVPVAVHVGGVDQVAARVQVTLQLGGRIVGVGVPAPRHGAEREPGNRQPASAERSLLHG
ncbi:hypothetical protein GCM10027614_14360 [Micromonospora vulcania]